MSDSTENQHHNPDSFNVAVNPDNRPYSLRFVEPLREDLAVERTQLDGGGTISYEGVSGADAKVIGISGMIDEDTKTSQELLAVVATDNGADLFAVVSIASTPELYSMGFGGQTHLKNGTSPHRDRIAKLSGGDGIGALPNRATVLVHFNRDSPNDVIPVRTQDLPGEVVVREDFTVGVDATGAVTVASLEAAEGVEVFMRKFETSQWESPTVTAEHLAYKGLRKLFTKKPVPEMLTITHVAGQPSTELTDPRHWAIDPEQAGYLLDALALSKGEWAT